MTVQSLRNAYGDSGLFVNRHRTSATPVPTAADGPLPPALQPSGVSPTPAASDLETAVAAVAKAIQPQADTLNFVIDRTSGKPLVRITDRETGALIRQIPSQEMLDIAKSIDRLQGVLMSQSA